MNIKSYTDIEQSKVLAKILPIESADMWYQHTGFSIKDGSEKPLYFPMVIRDYESDEDIPCWSLSALLDIMPKDKSVECSISYGYYNGKGEYIEKWLCAFEKEGETTDDFIIETFDGDNPIDACVEMILKLKRSNLL